MLFRSVQPDGKVLLAGNFTIVDGVTNNHIARLNGGVNIGSGSFAFLSPTYTVAENGGSVTITVQRLGGASGPIDRRDLRHADSRDDARRAAPRVRPTPR